MEKMIQIPEWQFKHIENALRLTNNIYHCHTKETAFDREIVKAYDFAKCALANAETSDSNCNKPHVTNCVALPEWLSKERCAMAAGIWNSHQEGDNKRVQAIKQIKEWAADAGYEIGFKKANELFKQHCL